MTQRIAVTDLSSLKEGRARCFDTPVERITLCRKGDQVFAFEERCTHALQPLEGARIKGDTLMCPFHGARFDLKTGAIAAPPALKPLRRFETDIDNGTVMVIFDSGAAE